MSHAEYASKQVPVLSRLVTALRQMPVVQSAVAKFKALLGLGAEPSPLIADARLDRAAVVPNDAIEIVDAAPAAAEPTALPHSETAPEPVVIDAFVVEAPTVADDAVERIDPAPAMLEPAAPPRDESVPQPVVMDTLPSEAPIVVDEAVEAVDTAPVIAKTAVQALGEPEPRAATIDAFVAETPVVAKAITAIENVAVAAAQPAEEDREALVRRRWRETGIRMWGAGHSTLRIQGRTALLPPKAGETMPQYDTLEFKLVGADIVCEGFVLEPPQRGPQRR